MKYLGIVGIIVLCGGFMIMGILAGQHSQLEAMKKTYRICLDGNTEACKAAQKETKTEFFCTSEYCWMEVL